MRTDARSRRTIGRMMLCVGAATPILAAGPPAQFEDESNRLAGFERVSLTSDSGGAAWRDFDLDGDLDLYLVNGIGLPNALFTNNGDGTFTDIAAAAGVANGEGNSAAFGADFDNDGDQDLLLAGEGQTFGPTMSPIKLYMNNGNGTFTDITASSGIVEPLTHADAAIGDIDNDGYLDIFFGATTNLALNIRPPSKLYRNNGGLTFSDVSDGSGVDTIVSNTVSDFADVNADGLIDLFATTAFPEPVVGPPGVRLWLNDGDGTFTEEPGNLGPVGRAYAGFDLGDFDINGATDFFCAAFGSTPSISGIPIPHALFSGDGAGSFTDVAAGIGVGEIMPFTLGVTAGDYNNDGFEDLLAAGAFAGAGLIGPGLSNPGTLLNNRGDGSFDAVTDAIQADLSTLDLRCVIRADFDADGFLDAVITTNRFESVSGAPVLLRNLGNANRSVTIRLRGTASNRDGFGAQIRVHAGGIPQTKECYAGGAFNSTASKERIFGLGTAMRTDSMSVRWPGGAVEQFPNRKADQIVTLVEGCPYDLNADLRVNFSDILVVLSNFRDPFTFKDLVAILHSWGTCDDRWGAP